MKFLKKSEILSTFNILTHSWSNMKQTIDISVDWNLMEYSELGSDNDHVPNITCVEQDTCHMSPLVTQSPSEDSSCLDTDPARPRAARARYPDTRARLRGPRGG